MMYYSTNRQSPAVDLKTATVQGQAPDKGLYYPERVPAFAPGWDTLKHMDRDELSYHVMKPYVANSIPDEELRRIAAQTVAFEFPLVKVTDDIYSLELFHGPTLAFKDVGARFMSRCLGYFNRGNDKKVTVLVATSGDTGGAVANGFENVEGIEVIILYPSGKVSPVQELQLTTCGKNITALEVQGTFDDCQAMVKQAFMDKDLAAKYQLTSANSINVARWLPQQLYYCFALQQWPYAEPPVISVPSGNFGNICAGMIGWASGLPVARFVAACNVNDVVPRFLRSGHYEPRQAQATISNAMDVGDPSNFVRIMELFVQNKEKLKDMLWGFTVNDDTTRQTITRVHEQTGYILDPHGAVGYSALEAYQKIHPGAKGLFLETAHPVKFPEVVETSIGKKLEIPDTVKPLLSRKKKSVPIGTGFDALKEYLL
ncbi:MAG TPA: threonine synthase [Phnomibacter sp.]|nr:threonine synthase [Phnomibacter sp.]